MKPREAWHHLPKWQRVGILFGGLFIQAREICPFGANVPGARCLLGDNRGFSAFAGRHRYRAYMGLDFISGMGYVRINPTCVRSGKCFRPHEIERSLPNWHPKEWPTGFDRNNKLDWRITSTSTRLSWKLANAAHFGPTWLLPEINGQLEITKAGRVDPPRLDGYPSFELYHRRRAGGAPTCVFRYSESGKNGWALALPSWLPGFGNGGSKC